MAFYGRITNNQANASMTFDKIYPNRVTMDANASEDGVFTGRFVLVEYSEADETTLQNWAASEGYTYNTETGIITDAEENTVEPDETDIYTVNYNTDKGTYPKLGRGYDSTVWRKVIAEDGGSYYVMLAELNSVVPSFGVEGEAPSEIPTKPHFDEDSTNVYYNLHVGTPWGFRIKPVVTNATQSSEPET